VVSIFYGIFYLLKSVVLITVDGFLECLSIACPGSSASIMRGLAPGRSVHMVGHYTKDLLSMQMYETPSFVAELKSVLENESANGTLLGSEGPSVVIADFLLHLMISDDEELAARAREDDDVQTQVRMVTAAVRDAEGSIPCPLVQLGQARPLCWNCVSVIRYNNCT
jgi:hypothetical protein